MKTEFDSLRKVVRRGAWLLESPNKSPGKHPVLLFFIILLTLLMAIGAFILRFLWAIARCAKQAMRSIKHYFGFRKTMKEIDKIQVISL